MKKLTALLMTLALLAVMMTSAMAYEPAEFTGTVNHNLLLTDSTLNFLPYDIIYTFTNDGGVEVVDPAFQSSYVNMIGSPTIAAITYAAGSQPTDPGAKKYIQALNIDWSNVNLTEPGIYRWKFTQTESTTDPQQANVSNNTPIFYLYAYVTLNGDNLTANVRLYSGEETKMENGFGESYPAKSLSLTLSKTVSGNQASHNQYFQFAISLTSPSTAAAMTYNIDYTNADTNVPATAYNAAVPNQPSSITVPAGQTASVNVWLKHGQNIVINGLLYNTAYTIIESNNNGYSVSGTQKEGTSTTTFQTSEVNDTAMSDSATVAYTNEKNTTVPTGIELETAAPIVGMILAMAMLALLFVGKRKEEIA